MTDPQAPARGLLAPGTPVTRDTLERAIELAAMSCARGPVQASVVLQLISDGEISGNYYFNRFSAYRSISLPFGLGVPSWKNLIARLRAAGFVLVRSEIDNGLRWQIYWNGASKEATK